MLLDRGVNNMLVYGLVIHTGAFTRVADLSSATLLPSKAEIIEITTRLVNAVLTMSFENVK